MWKEFLAILKIIWEAIMTTPFVSSKSKRMFGNNILGGTGSINFPPLDTYHDICWSGGYMGTNLVAPATQTIEKIYARVYFKISGSGNGYAQLREEVTAGGPDGALLAESALTTLEQYGFPSNQTEWTEFTLTSPYEIQAGVTYSLGIKFNNVNYAGLWYAFIPGNSYRDGSWPSHSFTSYTDRQYQIYAPAGGA